MIALAKVAQRRALQSSQGVVCLSVACLGKVGLSVACLGMDWLGLFIWLDPLIVLADPILRGTASTSEAGRLIPSLGVACLSVSCLGVACLGMACLGFAGILATWLGPLIVP